jgi:hypothetical protein|tara:strand:- start:173 stop:289 length:117 start_codon:yes stop_codon:yes gene_type:complete
MEGTALDAPVFIAPVFIAPTPPTQQYDFAIAWFCLFSH